MSEWPSAEREIAKKIACPNCGASVSGGEAICRFCGSLLREALSDNEFRKACRVFIKSLNKTMNNVFPPRLGVVFALGVIVGPLVAYAILKRSDWGSWAHVVIPLLVAFVGLIVGGIMIATEQKRTFHKQIKPRIEHFMRENGLTSTEFLAMARTQVKESDPLLEYLDEIVC